MTWRPTEATLFLERTVAPGVGDDEHQGFLVGDIWVDETADIAYMCLDNSVGAAVWSEVGSADAPIRNFLDLEDTPGSYVGEGGKTLKVNSGESGLEFLSTHYEGAFEASNIDLAAASSYIIECVLPRTDFAQGYLSMHIPLGAPYSRKRRLSSGIMFTTNEDKAIARTGRLIISSVVGYSGVTYYVYAWNQEGWSYDSDGQLGYTNGWRTYGTGQLVIRKVWIDGDKLKIQFDNTHGSYTVRLFVKGRYHVYQ